MSLILAIAPSQIEKHIRIHDVVGVHAIRCHSDLRLLENFEHSTPRLISHRISDQIGSSCRPSSSPFSRFAIYALRLWSVQRRYLSITLNSLTWPAFADKCRLVALSRFNFLVQLEAVVPWLRPENSTPTNKDTTLDTCLLLRLLYPSVFFIFRVE